MPIYLNVLALWLHKGAPSASFYRRLALLAPAILAIAVLLLAPATGLAQTPPQPKSPARQTKMLPRARPRPSAGQQPL